MHRIARRSAAVLGLLLASSTAQAQFTLYGVTNTNGNNQQLVRFSSTTPGTVTTIGGTGFNLMGIDFRPATGQLYGYTDGQLYTVNLVTGAATLVGPVGSAAGNVGFDFNPTVDRIRVTSNADQNYRLVPDASATTTDGTLAYAGSDVAGGQNPSNPSITSAAYTNSFAGATTTTLYGIDAARGTLVTVSPPNNGVLNTVGSLGLGASLSTITGFDIVTVGGVNTAFLSVLSSQGQPVSTLYQVDLSSGLASSLGTINTNGGLSGLSVVPVAASTVPEPGTWALFATGLVGLGAAARRRRTTV